tara:strand:+ start:2119 stop:3843 length:1725 start_codon:yes stop_codon:yes gene_type:complete
MKEEFPDYALKHSCSHLMASAIKELFPGVKFAIGPPIEDGFYYDFGGISLSEEDLPKIEAKMKEIAKKNLKFEMAEMSVADAKKLLKDQPFKLELLKDISGKITFYKHGDFSDLCEGPHVRFSKELKHFKLMKVAGAYWRGNEKNPMLTRVYGVVFKTKVELDAYLTLLEEAKKRDHKKLGKELDLFTFSPLVGSGLPMWTPKGALVCHLLDDFVWSLRKAKGYEKVIIPHLTKKALYETSGHWKKFQDELFKISTREGHFFVMKPMNCPHHAQIFARKQWSYRELPQRYCETTMMYRDEQSGELSGLSRVRSINIDDAHVFCRKDQVEQEINAIWDIINSFYSTFGYELQVRFSTHDPNQFEKFLGTPEVWAVAEEQILNVIKKRKVGFIEGVGEAAFYGPKIDFIAKDSLNREWQVATIQLDFNQPDRFDLTYAGEENRPERVVMIHAAIAGSFERFLSVLIEHLAGNFPTWLAPVQVKLLTVTDRNVAFAEQVVDELKKSDIRVELDTRSETIGRKVRDGQLERAPYIVTIGDKEVTNKSLAIRTRKGKVTFGVATKDFIKQVLDEVNAKQ